MGPQAPPLGHGSALVHLLDFSRAVLTALPNGTLRFEADQSTRQPGSSCAGSGAGSGGALAGIWVLAAERPGHYTLQHAATGLFLAVAGGQVVLSSTAERLQLFMDLARRVAVRLPDRACLQSGPGGAALAGRLPLDRARPSKLFWLEEAGLPSHALQAWPLRAALRCEQAGGGYLSACGRSLSSTAQVACCSEHFLLSLGGAAHLSAAAGSLVAPRSSLWAADGRRLLSHEPGTGQVLLALQHGASGGECFTVQLSCKGELALTAEPAPPAAAVRADAEGGSSRRCSSRRCSSSPCQGTPGGSPRQSTAAGCGSHPAAVVVQHGAVVCRTGAKPSRLALELAGGKPTLLLTAHGQLLGCPTPTGGRPCGILPASTAGRASGRGGSSSSSSEGAGPARASACAAAVQGCAWLLSHHGDSVYSLRHAASGRSLWVDELAVPCLGGGPPGGGAADGGGGGGPVFPDERLLFWLEPAWVSLQAPAPASAAEAAAAATAAAAAGRGGGRATAQRGGSQTGSPAAAFVRPTSSGRSSDSLTVAGFTLRSVYRVGGRHLYLSVLPDGLATTVHATAKPSRWELFSIIDYETLVRSPARLLDRLPCAPPPPAPQQRQPVLRRAVSMQAFGSTAVSSSSGSGSSSSAASAGPLSRRSSHGLLPRVPSLPAVQEHQPCCSTEPAVQMALQPVRETAAQLKPLASGPPRRSQSETALADLQQRQERPPQWLAQLLQQPARQPEGWGVCSAASLQAIACRQLCVTLLEQCTATGRQLTAESVGALEEELRALLPDEVAARIAAELRLLAAPPQPTKLSLQQLYKAATAAGGGGADGGVQALAVPAWAKPFLQDHLGDLLLRWQSGEAYLCRCCRGASGPLLPLDPYVNPSHHLFLTAMERTARGGGRVRLRARRRLDQADPLLTALKAGKLALLAWAAGRTVAALLCGRSSGAGASRQR